MSNDSPSPPSPTGDPHADRVALRAYYRKARAALSQADRDAANAAIAAHLDLYAPIKTASCVAAYAAFRGEVDLTAWCQAAISRGVQIALPLMAKTRGEMTFRAWGRESLRTNAIGIEEPDLDAPLVAPSDLDAVLVPLVAFDELGVRLGMGGGYYDRYFAHPARPTLIGLAYRCQQAPPLPRAAWDVTLDAVVHEGGVLEFR